MFMSSKGIACLTDRHELVELARRLKVRPDWHEPDERNLHAEVYGYSFDNAGTWPEMASGGDRGLEMHVVLYETTEVIDGDPTGKPIAAVNLADLFAWASERRRPEGD